MFGYVTWNFVDNSEIGNFVVIIDNACHVFGKMFREEPVSAENKT